MRKLIILLVSIIIITMVFTGCFTAGEPESIEKSITIIDSTGKYVELKLPVERIVSLNSGMSTLICAFGDSDKIVGRSTLSVFPSSLEGIEIVGERSSKPNMELIVQLEPDLLVADTQLKDEDREKLESLGIQVIVEPTSDPDRIFFIIRNFGLLLEKQEKAEEIIACMESYLNIVHERIARLELEKADFPTVYFEYWNDFKSISAQSSMHKSVVAAGGINIAAAEPFKIPKLSPEYILEKNPQIIVKRASRVSDLKELELIREEIMSTVGLKEVNAVKEENVYIFKSDIFLILNYPVGLSYYAKWFHPVEFSDINPGEIHRNLVDKFFGDEEWDNIDKEIFIYPEE
ncbi:MAG: ABC transporter substrate-binding protein [Actinomycetia bacterium]|nr:ABC transporter substrate-binding protein [Actinomycetes bacterium]